HMATRVIWSPLKTPEHEMEHDEKHESNLPTDLSGREILVLVPLAIVVFVLGVAPNGVLHSILKPIQMLQKPIGAAIVSEGSAPAEPRSGRVPWPRLRGHASAAEHAHAS